MYPVVSRPRAFAALLDPLHLVHLAHLAGHRLYEVTPNLTFLQMGVSKLKVR